MLYCKQSLFLLLECVISESVTGTVTAFIHWYLIQGANVVRRVMSSHVRNVKGQISLFLK